MNEERRASWRERRIGELNGAWAVLLRLALATYPMLIFWAAWVTVSIMTIRGFIDFAAMTTQDGERLRVLLEHRIDEHAGKGHPPEWVRREIDAIQERIRSAREEHRERSGSARD